MTKPQAAFFTIGQIERQRASLGKTYQEFLRVSTMSAGLYVLAAGSVDTQRPHQEDELYYVLRGTARFRAGDDNQPVAAGSLIFVPAKLDHHFFDIAEELVVLVFFAPAES